MSINLAFKGSQHIRGNLNKVLSSHVANYRGFASETQVRPTEESSGAVQSKTSSKDIHPFAKGLFMGRFETSVLCFPEVLDKDRLQTLEEMINPIRKLFTEKIDSKEIDAKAEIPKETLQDIKDLGLYGLQVPEDYGGLDLNATECTRIAEYTSLDGGIAVTLAAHQSIGYKGILLFGTEAQKRKYLPKLSSGEHTAAFCLTEPKSGSDAASISTKATLNPDGTHYILNGSKIWISNGGTADVFTVFAKTEHSDVEGKPLQKVTAFIVERAFGGITNGKPEDKLGIRGSNTCEVHFDNTPIPVENVINEPGKGFKVAMNILNSGRFSMGGAIAGIIKHLMKPTTEHAINREQFQKKLKDFPLIQEKFSRMTVTTYAMESMSYLTAGLIDSQENPDCSVEAAIVKVFSSEGGFNCVNDCLQVLGGMGYTKDYPHERYLRDGRIAHIFEGTNEILRLFISLSGLQHIATEMSSMVKKLRNPFLNVGLVTKKYIEHTRNRRDHPNLNLDLGGHLHPSLLTPSLWLEYGVKRLQYAIEVSLTQYGVGLKDEQLILKRIADVVIDLYGMTAVLSRSSRSYCIGLQNSDVEIRIANLFCFEANQRIKTNIQDILDGAAANHDLERQFVAESVFKMGGYPAEHPLTKN